MNGFVFLAVLLNLLYILLMINALRHIIKSFKKNISKECRLHCINRALVMYTIQFVYQIIVFGLILNYGGPLFLPSAGFGRMLVVAYIPLILYRHAIKKEK
jgi:ABC-type sulfate transport system permease subunit